MKYRVKRPLALGLAALIVSWTAGACTVLAVADTVGSLAVGTVGLAADAAIGTVKVAGKAAGKAADAVIGN